MARCLLTAIYSVRLGPHILETEFNSWEVKYLWFSKLEHQQEFVRFQIS